jgi:hypothetical protein
MSDFTKTQLFALAKGDYNTYLISKMSTFLNSSKRYYKEYKEKGGKKILKELEEVKNEIS